MPHADDQRLASEAAEVIAVTYESYLYRFRELTRRARGNFERCDWHAMQHDSARRLDLYNDTVQEGLRGLWALLGPRVADRPTWALLRQAYAERVGGRGDVELAETFFNSFTRRIFHTI